MTTGNAIDMLNQNIPQPYNSIQFIYQLRALKGQQENCT